MRKNSTFARTTSVFKDQKESNFSAQRGWVMVKPEINDIKDIVIDKINNTETTFTVSNPPFRESFSSLSLLDKDFKDVGRVAWNSFSFIDGLNNDRWLQEAGTLLHNDGSMATLTSLYHPIQPTKESSRTFTINGFGIFEPYKKVIITYFPEKQDSENPSVYIADRTLQFLT